MSELKRIYRLHFLEKLSFREMEKILSIPSSTLNDYVRRMKELELDEEFITQTSDEGLRSKLFPHKQVVRPRLELPDFKKIHLELQRKGVTLKLLHQEYIAHNSSGYSYSRFCAHYLLWRRVSKISMRQHHTPGDKLFIDFAGQTMAITNRETGEITRHPLYVCCLGFSSYTYCKLVESQANQHFCQAVVDSLSFYGGVPKLLVPDNLKSAVIKANFYDPHFNLAFKELSDYYRANILPARVRKPQDKSKVEISVSVAERWILAVLRDRVFYSLSEANAEIRKLLAKVNDKVMIHYGKSRRELFNEYEAAELMALPEESFIPRVLFKDKVRDDYHICYENRYYSVPHQYINRSVEIEVTDKCFNIFYQRNLIATHPIKKETFGKSTLKEHMPINHQKAYELDTITEEGLMIRAEKIGNNTFNLVSSILKEESNNPYKKRRCIGILLTAEKSEVNEAELASGYMIALKDYRVDNYRNILKNKSYLITRLLSETYLPKKRSEYHENVRGSEAFS